MSYRSSCHVCHDRSILANDCDTITHVNGATNPNLWTWCSRSRTATMPEAKQTACAHGAKASNCHACTFERIASRQRPRPRPRLHAWCAVASRQARQARQRPRPRPRPWPPQTAASRQRPREASKAILHNRNAQGLAIFCKFECLCHGAHLSTGLTPMVDNAA